jgi:hypothetical protein
LDEAKAVGTLFEAGRRDDVAQKEFVVVHGGEPAQSSTTRGSPSLCHPVEEEKKTDGTRVLL